MKKSIIATTAIVIFFSMAAAASDFWSTFGERLAWNYSVGTASIPDISNPSQRLSNRQMTSIITKSFSHALGSRIQQISRRRKASAILCFFTNEPDRCFVKGVLDETFSEIRILNPPSFSDKFLQKIKKYYAYTISGDNTKISSIRRAAGNVPRKKNFNPRFAFDLSRPEIILATPFYTFFNIYAEPKFGSSTGPSVTFILNKFFVNVDKEGALIKYRVRNKETSRGYTSISIRPEGEFIISNEFILK